MKMKTIKQWLEELPEPYKSQAISNCSCLDAQHTYYSQDRALGAAFMFELTPEGWQYWIDFHKSIGGKFFEVGGDDE